VTTGKLGITGLAGIHYYVRDLARSRRFYCDFLAFDEVGHSSPELERRAGSARWYFRPGRSRSSAPRRSGKAAARRATSPAIRMA
jgi:catechol 2,3-dioxygenase-like lactoylglutathione lyase family enzyme